MFYSEKKTTPKNNNAILVLMCKWSFYWGGYIIEVGF